MYLESVYKSNPTEFDRGDDPVIDTPEEAMDDEENPMSPEEVLRSVIEIHLLRQLLMQRQDEFKQLCENKNQQSIPLTRPTNTTSALTSAAADEDEIIHVNIDGEPREFRFRR
jgi:hypothetical protein